MTAIATRQLVSDSLALTRRNLEHVRQIPEKLLDVTLQPLMFVLLFAYVFGGVIAIPGGTYHEYFLGGILVQTLAFGLMGPGMSIASDLSEGMVDRIRSLPTSRAAYLVGHVIAELMASLLALAILTVTGLIVGWRIHTDVPHALAGFALLILLAFTMIWLGTLVGIKARSSEGVQGVAFTTVFPLTFMANTFVPSGGLPDGVRQFAEYNPVSALAAAVRTLFGNPTAIPSDAPWPLQHSVLAAFAWCALGLAITAPMCIRAFRKRTVN